MLARKVKYVLISINCPWPYSQLWPFFFFFFYTFISCKGICDKPQNWPWILHLLQLAIWILALIFIRIYKHIYASLLKNTEAYSHVLLEENVEITIFMLPKAGYNYHPFQYTSFCSCASGIDFWVVFYCSTITRLMSF